MNPITTQQVNCRDCHRCMRYCPVKAVGIEKGQARLVEEKCILCGKCVTECPQHARQVGTQLHDIQKAMKEGRSAVLSLAPSFVAVFPEYTPAELFDRLHHLGFKTVEETAVGAEAVSRIYSSLLSSTDKTVISACCPVIVSAVQKYYPDLAKNLAPVVSPMLAHAKLLKERFGPDAYVVFAGPCIAKIAEAEAAGGLVDAVLTFEQLRQWLSEEPGATITEVTEQTASERLEAGSARYYPIAGGILKSFMRRETTDTDIIAVDSLENCFEVLDGLRNGEISPRFIEALACTGGCINGPASGLVACTPAKRRKVTDYAGPSPAINWRFPDTIPLRRSIQAEPVQEQMPSEARIREVLRLTGKTSRQDEKNCGACGYNTCREKAIAVCQGLTEIDTCVPYMRSKAESFANIIVDNSLNAIIVVNNRLEIQEFNPAAETMFGQPRVMVKGVRLTGLMDCTDVISAIRSGEIVNGKRVEFSGSSLVANQKIIPVPEHSLAIIVFSDITPEEKRNRELAQMRMQTVEKASEIITKQMQVAQEIAGLLGETTAETKGALLELISLLKDKGEG